MKKRAEYRKTTSNVGDWLRSCVYNDSGILRISKKTVFDGEMGCKHAVGELRKLALRNLFLEKLKDDCYEFSLTEKGRSIALHLYKKKHLANVVMTDKNTVSVKHTNEVGIKEYKRGGYNIQLAM